MASEPAGVAAELAVQLAEQEESLAEVEAALQEQEESLAEVEAALLEAGGDADLLDMQQQLSEGIQLLRASLAELHSAAGVRTEHEQQPQQQHQQLPDWLVPGARCRFTWTDGRAHHGIVASSHDAPDHNTDATAAAAAGPQVGVAFAYPTLPHMLHTVTVHPGQVLPADPANAAAGSRLAVGSRVLALLAGEQLWVPAEVTAVQPGRDPGQQQQHQQQQQQHAGGSRFTVRVVGQQRIATLPAAQLIPSELAAGVRTATLDSELPGGGGSQEDTPAAAAAAAARTASDMSISGSSSGLSGSSSGSGSSSDSDAADTPSGTSRRAARVILGAHTNVLEHARLAAEAGVQQETTTFAAWDDRGRGIASRLMAKMGFRRGRGLGKTGNGITAPLDITVLPAQRGLGAASKHHHHHRHHRHRHGDADAAGDAEQQGQQQQLGSGAREKLSGRRRKRAKAAAARHAAGADDRQRQAAMEAATGEQGLFAFINSNLGAASEAASVAAAMAGEAPRRQQTAGSAALASAAAASAGGNHQGAGRGALSKQQQQKQKQVDRKGLVGSQDDVSQAKARVAQLTAMLERNKGNASLASQVRSKLVAAQREYEAVAARHRQLHKSAAAADATAKWMGKF